MNAKSGLVVHLFEESLVDPAVASARTWTSLRVINLVDQLPLFLPECMARKWPLPPLDLRFVGGDGEDEMSIAIAMADINNSFRQTELQYGVKHGDFRGVFHPSGWLTRVEGSASIYELIDAICSGPANFDELGSLVVAMFPHDTSICVYEKRKLLVPRRL
jgi:hypothetical protein